jgi:hypothetical protein
MRARRLGFLLLATTFACGGGDDDGEDGAGQSDAGIDGGGGDDPDASTGPYTGLGQSCTGEGQGDCPDGFECMPLTTGSWCSVECTMGAPGDAMCAEGYDGPGQARCFIGVDEDQNGSVVMTICGVVCEDTSGQIGCDESICDDTCPDDLTCTAELMNQDEEVVGMGCQ